MRTFAIVLAATLLISSAQAASLPEFAGPFVNGGTYTNAGVKDKVVVLYFYEEG